MSTAVLRGHWTEALSTAEVAVYAAREAHCLAAEEIVRHQQLLSSERHWLQEFQWSTVRLGSSPDTRSQALLTSAERARGVMSSTPTTTTPS
jgi:hypothetical protein